MEAQYIYIGGAVLVVALVLFMLKRKRGGRQHHSADELLNLVDVHLAYGLDDKVRELLQEGRYFYPDDERIVAKQSELGL